MQPYILKPLNDTSTKCLKCWKPARRHWNCRCFRRESASLLHFHHPATQGFEANMLELQVQVGTRVEADYYPAKLYTNCSVKVHSAARAADIIVYTASIGT